MRRRLTRPGIALALTCLLGAGLPAAAAVSPLAGQQPPAGCHDRLNSHDGLNTITVPPPKGVNITDDHVNVILPQGYCDPSRGSARYPVLYLLHGAGDTYGAWAAKTDVVSFSKAYRLIIVMPDGGANKTAGWYSNWLDGEYQWETYHIAVLQGFIDDNYRTLRDDLGIAGLSMGGFGAMSYAARHPGMFKAAASFSGALDMLYGAPVTGVVFTQLHSMYGTPNAGVWGDQIQNYRTWSSHNPASLAARLKGTAVFLASGTGTPGGAHGDDPGNPGGYALENGIFQMNLSMVRALDLAGVAHTDDFYPGGYHGWPYWQADLHWALPQIASILDAGAAHH
ncbi:MAG TPA: alpha/beta hydrolase family protein [Acidimicrobiales bacterium]